MIIANPLLMLSEFRFSGTSKYPHAGRTVRLGAGQSVSVAGWLSPVEANFTETALGASTRGSIALNNFYVVRQNLVNEKIWHWTDGNWTMHGSTAQQPDDPDAAFITFNPRPAEVSFYDSPGFMPFHFFSMPPEITRVCALQNFSLWINVSPRHSHGTFQAASNEVWHHVLCLEKNESGWQFVSSQSFLGRGEFIMNLPLWNGLWN
jgi:hypothetical protein